MRKSAEALVTGQQEAATKFIEYVIEQIECDEHTAESLLRYYLKLKLVKLDPIGRRFNVVHGGLLDTEVLERAVAMMKKDAA